MLGTNSLPKDEIVLLFWDITDPNAFDAGAFITADEDYTILAAINENGEDDGLVLIENELINKIEYKSKYTEKLSRLVKLKKTKLMSFQAETQDTLGEMLNYAALKRLPVMLKMIGYDEDDVAGTITEINDEFSDITCLNEYGEADGHKRIYNDDIIAVYINTKYLRDLISL